MTGSLSLNKRHAVIVRIGEKKLLYRALKKVGVIEMSLRAIAEEGQGKKRKGGAGSTEDTGSAKKSKR